MTSTDKKLQRLLNIKEVSAVLNASEKTVRRLIKDGKMPVVRCGRMVRIAQADLDRFIAAHRFG